MPADLTQIKPGALYTQREASRLLGLPSAHAIGKAIRQGELPAIRIGRSYQIVGERLLEWLRRKEIEQWEGRQKVPGYTAAKTGYGTSLTKAAALARVAEIAKAQKRNSRDIS